MVAPWLDEGGIVHALEDGGSHCAEAKSEVPTLVIDEKFDTRSPHYKGADAIRTGDWMKLSVGDPAFTSG